MWYLVKHRDNFYKEYNGKGFTSMNIFPRYSLEGLSKNTKLFSEYAQ
jgi:hypothetical protein